MKGLQSSINIYRPIHEELLGNHKGITIADYEMQKRNRIQNSNTQLFSSRIELDQFHTGKRRVEAIAAPSIKSIKSHQKKVIKFIPEFNEFKSQYSSGNGHIRTKRKAVHIITHEPKRYLACICMT